MTQYEIFTLVVSLLSVVIAITSLVRTRKIAAEQLKLERITAQLAERQISEIDEAAHEKTQPRLRVDLTKLGKDYQFIIANRGDGSAYNLTFELVGCPDPPLAGREVGEKFPTPELKSQSRVKLFAAIHMGSPRTYVVRLKWSDSNGSEHSEDFHVSL